MATERNVKARLSVQLQQYVEGMEKAAQKTRETANEAQRLAAQGDAFKKLGATSMAAGGLIAVGLGVAISKFAEFDQAMSAVEALSRMGPGK